MRRILFATPLLALLAAHPSGAADGKIPVWMPMEIAAPGHYILTRDIAVSTGPAVTIIDDGVTLDLNGFTLSSTDFTRPVIQIGGTSASQKGIIVIDGKVEGGMHGILYAAASDDHKPLRLDRLTLSGSSGAAVKAFGFSKLEAQGIIIINSLSGFDLQASAPGIPAPPVPPQASIRGAGIRARGGIHCTGVTCSVRDMTMEYTVSAAPATPALRFDGSNGSDAFGIVVIGGMPASAPPVISSLGSCWLTLGRLKVVGPGGGSAHCIDLDAASRDFIIDDGDISECGGDGIHALGTIGRISRMSISGMGGHGIFAGGTNVIIDDGDIFGNTGAGIWFETSSHVYRNNILGGNSPNVGGPGAADARNAGGNVSL